MKILLNRCKCLKCGDTITSRHVHDFVMCKCGAIFTDGGNEYCRRGGEPGDIEDMSEYIHQDIIDKLPMFQDLADRLNSVDEKEIDTKYTREITCPHCGYVESDSYEFNDGEYECGECGASYEVERIITVEYTTYKR